MKVSKHPKVWNTQYSLDLTQNFIVLKKIIGGYMLKNFNFTKDICGKICGKIWKIQMGDPLLVRFCMICWTSRDRPKSAPYPRLKNSEKTSKSQVFFFTVIENFSKKLSKKLHTQKNGPSGAKRGKLPKLSTFLSQLKVVPFGEKTNFQKSHNAEKQKGGTLRDFYTTILL